MISCGVIEITLSEVAKLDGNPVLSNWRNTWVDEFIADLISVIP